MSADPSSFPARGQAGSGKPPSPACLRTEYLWQPLGLDVPRPRLSWKLQSTSLRGVSQIAYHIRVARTRVGLMEEKADLWDSGEVCAATSTHVEYDGETLTPRMQCHWSVRVQDQTGFWSDWASPVFWTMGPAAPHDWTARWIGRAASTGPVPPLPLTDDPPADNTLRDPWFRRSFRLPAKPTRATAFIASIGYHELYVNGHRIGDAVLAPSVTDNSKRARYMSYEIGNALQAGDNVIALWLGAGWSLFSCFLTDDKPYGPIVLGQFDIDLPNGSTQRIVTDATWKTAASPNQLTGIWYFMNFGGERYDGLQEGRDWAAISGSVDQTWEAATEYSPALIVSAEKTEPNRLKHKIVPQSIHELAPRTHRVDMGRNFTGWYEVSVHGQPGDTVEFLFSERENAEVTHRLRSTYVIGPEGCGVFRNRFNYAVGRWMTIRGLRQAPALTDVRGWVIRNDFEAAASFECSDPLLNRIYETTLWTFENLALGGYVVDCPHRERMGYGGDGHATLGTALSAFSLGAFFTKWAEDWRDVQGKNSRWGHSIPPDQFGGGGPEEGNLPYTAPTHYGGGGPAWSGFCVQLPWEVYQRYGDRRILEENFTTIQKWLRFLETKAKGDLLQRWGGKWDFLGDWLWPDATDVNGQTRETLFFNNCSWIYNLQTAAEIARVLGENQLAHYWTERAANIRRAVHSEFFNSADHSYVDGSQAYLAIALLSHVPPAESRARVWQRLEREILVRRQGHIHAGITGGAFLFKALLQECRDDLLYTMVSQTDYPGWGHMLSEGATTFWEAWEGKNGTHLHSSFLFVGAWFIHGVLGIQPVSGKPGFKEFVVRPGVIDQPSLTWASGHYDSIAGRIAVAWKSTDATFALSIEVPPNTSALVHLPTTDALLVLESGRALVDVSHVRPVRLSGGRLVLAVESGSYRFTCPLKSSLAPLSVVAVGGALPAGTAVDSQESR